MEAEARKQTTDISRAMRMNCEAVMIEMYLQAERERLYKNARQKIYGGCNDTEIAT